MSGTGKVEVNPSLFAAFVLRHGSLFLLDPRDEQTDTETGTWLEHSARLRDERRGYAFTLMFRVVQAKKLVHEESGFLAYPQYSGPTKAKQFPLARRLSALDAGKRSLINSSLARVRKMMLCRDQYNQWDKLPLPEFWSENEQQNFHQNRTPC